MGPRRGNRCPIWHLGASKMRRAESCEMGTELRFFGGLRGPSSLLDLPALASAGPAGPPESPNRHSSGHDVLRLRQDLAPETRFTSQQGRKCRTKPGPRPPGGELRALSILSRPRPYTMDQTAGCNGWKGRVGELSSTHLCMLS